MSFEMGSGAITVAGSNSGSFLEQSTCTGNDFMQNYGFWKGPEHEMNQRKGHCGFLPLHSCNNKTNNLIFMISEYWNFAPQLNALLFVVGVVFQPHNYTSYSCVHWCESNTICHLDSVSPRHSPQQGSEGAQLNHSLDGSQSNSIKPLKRM